LRKVLYTLVASALVVALIPATALGRSHHRRHHHQARVHHKIRHKQFGRSDAPTTSAMSDNAGTVASFDGTKLTIQLTDGSTVSGTVNNDTEIECEGVDGSHTSFHGDDHGSGRSGGDNHGDRGDRGDRGDDNDNDDNDMGNCDTSDLTPGTMVHEASLTLSGAGATWDKVELLTSSNADDND
jgi:hypothetical protein